MKADKNARCAIGNEANERRENVKYGFQFTAFPRRNCNALFCRNHAQKILRKLTIHNENENRRMNVASDVVMERKQKTREHGKVEHNIGERVKQFAEIRNGVLFPRNMSIEKIREFSDCQKRNKREARNTNEKFIRKPKRNKIHEKKNRRKHNACQSKSIC